MLLSCCAIVPNIHYTMCCDDRNQSLVFIAEDDVSISNFTSGQTLILYYKISC